MFFNMLQIGKILADHFFHQLHLRQVFDRILTHKLAVAQDGDRITDLVNLFQEVGNKDNPYTAVPEVPHQTEQHRNFLVIQRGSRLVQNQHFAFGINGTGNRNHLLYGQ